MQRIHITSKRIGHSIWRGNGVLESSDCAEKDAAIKINGFRSNTHVFSYWVMGHFMYF